MISDIFGLDNSKAPMPCGSKAGLNRHPPTVVLDVGLRDVTMTCCYVDSEIVPSFMAGHRRKLKILQHT